MQNSNIKKSFLVLLGEGGNIVDALYDGDRTVVNRSCYIETDPVDFPICTVDGNVPLYRWDGSHVIPRTEAEIEADRKAIPPLPPTEQEQLRADVDYLAVMTGVEM